MKPALPAPVCSRHVFAAALLAALCFGSTTHAAESLILMEPPSAGPANDDISESVRADWATRRAAAQARGNAASEALAAAKATLEQERAACFKAFFVTRCQNQARERYLLAEAAARQQDVEAKAAERQVRKEELEAQDAKRQHTEKQRELEGAARAAQTSAERARIEGEINAETARKQAEAETGKRRHAEQDAERARKRAEHDKRVAEKMQEAARRAASEKKQ